MHRVTILGLISLFFLGCAEKPMATSVVDLAGNQEIVGWGDAKSISEKKVFKEHIFSPVLKIKDSDKDGVIDKFDRCPNTPKNLLVNHYGCPILKILRIHFDFNSTKIKSIYYPQIKEVADILKANPNLKVEISGYTDNIGDEKYNLALSKKRAEAVKEVLVKKYHISPDRLVVKGYGKKYPLVPNTNETNRVLNRRVEIVQLNTLFKSIVKKSIGNKGVKKEILNKEDIFNKKN